MHVVYTIFIPLTHDVSDLVPVKAIKPKDAPATYELDLEFATVHQNTYEHQKVSISERWLTIGKTVTVGEFRYRLPNSFETAQINLKNQINEHLKAEFLSQTNYPGDLIEEYLAVVIDDAPLSAERFIKKHAYGISRFIRSIDEKISAAQAEEILATRVSYSQDYMTVVDWEGAIIFAPLPEAEDDIDLLTIANYQLLKYRLLDRQIEDRLQAIQTLINQKGLRWLDAKHRLQLIINTQIEFMLDFDKIDRSLLLIGDWYSAKLYRHIVNKFYINDWRSKIHTKLETLAQIEEMARQNFTLSWDRLFDVIQLGGWLILLVGYFVLFYVDLAR